MEKKQNSGGMYVPQRLLSNKYFLQWVGTREYSIWMELWGKIIRKKNKYELPNLVYDKFYTKGILATGWRLTALADTLGHSKSNKGNISMYIKQLEQKNLLKKRKVLWNKKQTIIYELGYVDPETNTEVAYPFEYFTKMEAKEQLEKCKLQ